MPAVHARVEVRRLAAVRSARVDVVLLAERDVHLFDVIAVQVSEVHGERAVRILGPALEDWLNGLSRVVPELIPDLGLRAHSPHSGDEAEGRDGQEQRAHRELHHRPSPDHGCVFVEQTCLRTPGKSEPPAASMWRGELAERRTWPPLRLLRRASWSGPSGGAPYAPRTLSCNPLPSGRTQPIQANPISSIVRLPFADPVLRIGVELVGAASCRCQLMMCRIVPAGTIGATSSA